MCIRDSCYVVGFNELQAYNAASGLEYYIPDYATNGAAVVLGVVFTIATAAVIFGGQKRISAVSYTHLQDPQTAAGLNGMPLVQMAVYHFAGDVGIAFITAAVFLFA